MAKATIVAGDGTTAASNGFVQVRASGLRPGTSHALMAGVVGGPSLPPIITIADKGGNAAESVFLFQPGKWQFQIGLNTVDDAVASCDLDVQ